MLLDWILAEGARHPLIKPYMQGFAQLVITNNGDDEAIRMN
jgi:hypothetical protein